MSHDTTQKKEKDILEEYCIARGYVLAERIDSKMSIIVKPRPSWCPEWIYKKIIKETIEIINHP